MKDIAIRALKTFVQAFLGILIPEIILILNNQEMWSDWKAVIIPFVASGLAAGISAVWNMILNKSNKTDTIENEEA